MEIVSNDAWNLCDFIKCSVLASTKYSDVLDTEVFGLVIECCKIISKIADGYMTAPVCKIGDEEITAHSVGFCIEGDIDPASVMKFLAEQKFQGGRECEYEIYPYQVVITPKYDATLGQDGFDNVMIGTRHNYGIIRFGKYKKKRIGDFINNRSENATN